MNGATAEPSVRATSNPRMTSVSAIGRSQYRFRVARKRKKSRKMTALDTSSERNSALPRRPRSVRGPAKVILSENAEW